MFLKKRLIFAVALLLVLSCNLAVAQKQVDADAHFRRGEAFLQSQQLKKAIAEFKEAIRLKPDLTAAHEKLAIAYLYAQRFAEAIESLLKATNLEPSRPLPHKLLGLAYLVVDQKDKAVAEYQTLKSLDAEMADYLDTAIRSPQKPQFGVSQGELITVPEPEYPSEAKLRGIKGTVTVIVAINEKGLVTSAQATSGPIQLRAAAEAAAMKARFRPTKLSGKPVAVNGVVSFNFR